MIGVPHVDPVEPIDLIRPDLVPRDPWFHGVAHAYHRGYAVQTTNNLTAYVATLAGPTYADANRLHGLPSLVLYLVERHRYAYTQGMPLAQIAGLLKHDVRSARQLFDWYSQLLVAEHPSEQAAGLVPMVRVDALEVVALFIFLVEDPALLKEWVDILLRPEPAARRYEADVLLHAFLGATWPVLGKYPNHSKFPAIQNVWHGLHDVLAQPTTMAREAALAAYMGQWGRLHRYIGWKPRRVVALRHEDGRVIDLSQPNDDLFTHFAYEVAMVVCAWDLDDSRFRDHLYYPRDLVDHYRAHVRHTRDGWRAPGVGPDIQVAPLPPKPRADLVRSKHKGYARWVELACDGDVDAHAAVLEQTGRLRSLRRSTSEAMAALAENGQALLADANDDATLASQIDGLLERRSVPTLDADAFAGAGPSRCEALMGALRCHLTSEPYTLLQAEGDDDWQSVVVRRDHDAEFIELSRSLGVDWRRAA